MPVEAMRRLFRVSPSNDRLGNQPPLPNIFPRHDAPVVRLRIAHVLTSAAGAIMKRWWFSEERTIAVLKEQESGKETADVCQRYGISDAPARRNQAGRGRNCGFGPIVRVLPLRGLCELAVTFTQGHSVSIMAKVRQRTIWLAK